MATAKQRRRAQKRERQGKTGMIEQVPAFERKGVLRKVLAGIKS